MRVLAPPASTSPKSTGVVMDLSADIALAAALLDEPRIRDHDVVRQRRAHAVDRQRRDACGGQRFHLDAGLVVPRHRAAHDCVVALHVDGELAALDTLQMTEGDELLSGLC